MNEVRTTTAIKRIKMMRIMTPIGLMKRVRMTRVIGRRRRIPTTTGRMKMSRIMTVIRRKRKSWLINNWILTSCQLHRVISVQTNLKTLLMYANPFSSLIRKVNPYTNIKTKHAHTNTKRKYWKSSSL